MKLLGPNGSEVAAAAVLSSARSSLSSHVPGGSGSVIRLDRLLQARPQEQERWPKSSLPWIGSLEERQIDPLPFLPVQAVVVRSCLRQLALDRLVLIRIGYVHGQGDVIATSHKGNMRAGGGGEREQDCQQQCTEIKGETGDFCS